MPSWPPIDSAATLRLTLRATVITIRNSAPDTMPWEIIWNTLPATPCVVPAKMPMVTKPICATEE